MAKVSADDVLKKTTQRQDVALLRRPHRQEILEHVVHSLRLRQRRLAHFVKHFRF